MSEHQSRPQGESAELPDHETLSRLALESPLAFEDLRQQLIEGLINTAPGRIQPRLRGIQFRVDGIRRLTHSSLGATIKIYNLMWSSFLDMDQQLRDFVCATKTKNYRPVRALAESQPNQSAKVIQFRPPQLAVGNVSTQSAERLR